MHHWCQSCYYIDINFNNGKSEISISLLLQKMQLKHLYKSTACSPSLFVVFIYKEMFTMKRIALFLGLFLIYHSHASAAALNGLTPFELDANLCDFTVDDPADCTDAQYGAFDWDGVFVAGPVPNNPNPGYGPGVFNGNKYSGIQNNVFRLNDGGREQGSADCLSWYYDSTSQPAVDSDAYSGVNSPGDNPWPAPTPVDPQGNTDFCIFYGAAEVIEVPAPGGAQFVDVLYLGAAINLSATGSRAYVLPLFADVFAPRTGGELAIVTQITGAVPDLSLGEWNAGTNSWDITPLVGLSTDDVECATNSGGQQLFIECAINLTALELLPENSCEVVSFPGLFTINTFNFNANFQDFAQAQDANGNVPAVTNCGQVQIEKIALGPNETFFYGLQHTDGNPVHTDPLLTDTVPPLLLADIDGDANVGEMDLLMGFNNIYQTLTAPTGDPIDKWGNVIASPDYILTEQVSILPDDWEIVEMECTWYDRFGEAPDFIPGFVNEVFTISLTGFTNFTGGPFAITPDAISIDDMGNIVVNEAREAECTITNRYTRLDYGDAPDSYGTNAASNGAVHAVVKNVLGANELVIGPQPPDPEDGSMSASAGADWDDNDPGPPSDEGSTIITSQSNYFGDGQYLVSVPVLNIGLDPGVLVAWIDFGDFQTPDGSFLEAIDRSSPDLAGFVSDNGSCVDPINNDGTFSTGNIPSGCVGTAVLKWTGLPILPANTNFTLNTFIRVRFTKDPNFLSDASPSPVGLASDGEVEDHPLTLTSTPVTMSYFDSNVSGSRVVVDWGTSSELFNVGFQLWALDGSTNKWHTLHDWLVRSGSGNAVEPQSYRKSARIPGQIATLAALGISSVDSDGTEHYYGPFTPGERYGSLSQLEPIPWDDIRAENDARMADLGYAKDRVNGYRKVTDTDADTQTQFARAAAGESVVEFGISESGMYRITASQLLAAGTDWTDVPKGDIALLDARGNPVVRFVRARGSGGGNKKTLGSNGEIFFYGQAPDDYAGLYTNQSRYRLVQDSSSALNAPKQSKQGVDSDLSASYRAVTELEEDKLYTLNSQGADPWVSVTIVAQNGKPYGYGWTLNIEPDMLADQGAELRFELGRSSALPAVDKDGDGNISPEHQVQGVLRDASNNLVWLESVAETGSGPWSVAMAIPAGIQLGDSNGDVRVAGIFSAGADYDFSEVMVDSVALAYSRPYNAKAGEDHLAFTGPNAGEAGYEVTVPDRGVPWIFASDGTNLVRILYESYSRVTDTDGSKQQRVRFAALQGAAEQGVDIHYWVSGTRAIPAVEDLGVRTVASRDALLAQAQAANYLLVAHPAFMGPELDSYAAFKASQGHLLAQVNYLDVVDAFGGGQAGPHGLDAYLEALEVQGNIDNVLLVGGSIYDHTNNLESGAVTYIPAHYGVSGYSRFTATDTPYITNGDGDLFAAIGRWPAREISDVQALVTKSMAWAASDRSAADALLIAEPEIDGEGIDFAEAVDIVSDVLPGGWNTRKVYVDQIPGDNPVAQARTEIVDGLNAAPEVVIFNGHASTSQLSNKGLFRAQDVSQVTADGAEIWVPMSCYVTFYESTHVNTLAHQLLFTGNAVNITGAMLLSDQATNLGAGKAVLDAALNRGSSLGEAVNDYKTQLRDPWLNTNWTVLGDPSNGF